MQIHWENWVVHLTLIGVWDGCHQSGNHCTCWNDATSSDTWFVKRREAWYPKCLKMQDTVPQLSRSISEGTNKTSNTNLRKSNWNTKNTNVKKSEFYKASQRFIEKVWANEDTISKFNTSPVPRSLKGIHASCITISTLVLHATHTNVISESKVENETCCINHNEKKNNQYTGTYLWGSSLLLWWQGWVGKIPIQKKRTI